ncbi:MAG: FAD-dependent oxidoreductase [Lentisphaeria bacterium]|nr:FAD-dependent oxidoreductase [Lentisphaeria bacterium]
MGKEIQCDCCVVGGGSAGFAAALAAAENGLNTILVEKLSQLGGTASLAGVNCFEPVIGGGKIAERLSRILLSDPAQCGIYRVNRHFSIPAMNQPPFPGCEAVIDPAAVYEDTLCSYIGSAPDILWNKRRGIIFEPDFLSRTMLELLTNAGCRVLLSSEVSSIKCSGRYITEVVLTDDTVIRADSWIDCCSILARLGDCKVYFGRDTYDDFQEPDAPRQKDASLNGATRIFRITPADEEIPASPVPAENCTWRESYPPMMAVQYPCGDYNCNMLPGMSGQEYFSYGDAAAKKISEERIREYWLYLQGTYPEFRKWRIKSIFPEIGIRESYRVECRYMLTEKDILKGMEHPVPDAVAVCDHGMDLHGVSGPGRKTGAYRIPFGCLCPVKYDNLLIAGRCAGFSSLAASSCRLSRTMMQLGETAGKAAAIAFRKHCDFTGIDGTESGLSSIE